MPETFEQIVERAKSRLIKAGFPLGPATEAVDTVLSAIGFTPDSVIVRRNPSLRMALTGGKELFDHPPDSLRSRADCACDIWSAMLAAAEKQETRDNV